jgi:hypothetical protein
MPQSVSKEISGLKDIGTYELNCDNFLIDLILTL